MALGAADGLPITRAPGGSVPRRKDQAGNLARFPPYPHGGRDGPGTVTPRRQAAAGAGGHRVMLLGVLAVRLSGLGGQMRSASLLRCARIAAAVTAAAALTLP